MSTRARTLEPKMFVEAAQVQFERSFNGACYAIYIAGNTDDYKSGEHIYFNNLLMPGETHEDLGWYGGRDDESNLARQLGLLLCAEVLKDETKVKRKRK